MSEKENKNVQMLKELRETRREAVEKAKETIRTQSGIIKKIREQLKSGPRTIPEIADAVQMPSAQVMQFVAGLKKYGLLTEGAKVDDYFQYELTK